MEWIPFCSPSISERDTQYVADSLAHCTGQLANDFQHRFERSLADYLGVRHAIAVSSRTAATHVALAALGVGPGHEVIVPDVMPASSLWPLRYLGATPVFADINPDSWCLSADSFKQSITPRTKAVMPIDLYGNIPEMHRIRAIAHARGIAILEDASDALGGEYLGRRAGSLGDVAVFGFDRVETLTAGEGGMVVTNCDRLASNIGLSLGDAGFDYRISPMQAALGVAQLERIDDLASRKRQITGWYRQALGEVASLKFSVPTSGSTCLPSEVTVVFDASTRLTSAMVVDEAAQRGIECKPMFRPASSLDAYGGSLQARVAQSRNRVSYELSQRAVSLPSGSHLSRRQMEKVAAEVYSLVARDRGVRPHRQIAA